ARCRRAAARTHGTGTDLRSGGHAGGSRRGVRCRSVRLAPCRQPARGEGTEWRPDPRLFPETEPVRLRREVLHRARRTLRFFRRSRSLDSNAGRRVAMAWLASVTLSGGRVRLEPLASRHCRELSEAVADGELWRLWYTTVPAPERMQVEIERRLQLQ